MAKPEVILKIRQKSTGKFSTGGCYPHFTRQGKTWRSDASLNAHLRLHGSYGDDFEIVRYETREVGTEGFDQRMKPIRAADIKREIGSALMWLSHHEAGGDRVSAKRSRDKIDALKIELAQLEGVSQ